MAGRLTEDEKETIAKLITQGHSRQQIREQTGRGLATIDRVAKSIGWRPDQSTALRVKAANEARSAFSRERRARIAEQFTEECERLLAEMRQPALVYSFGGEGHEFHGKVLPTPPNGDKLALMRSARDAMRTVLDIDRHDRRTDEGAALVDQWLQALTGSQDG